MFIMFFCKQIYNKTVLNDQYKVKKYNSKVDQ